MDEIELELEFFFVADGAHAVNGKLYVLGGGWTHLWLPSFPSRSPLPFAVAFGLRVPWNQTNRKFAWRVDAQDADNQPLGDDPEAWGEVEQGRPPGLTPGADQRVVMAIPLATEFPAPGRYSYVLSIDDDELGRAVIEVGQAAPAQGQPPPQR